MEEYPNFISVTILPNDEIKKKYDELIGVDDPKNELLAHINACTNPSFILKWYKTHYPFEHPTLPEFSGKALLIGPTGTGKTTIAKGIADEYSRRIGKEVYLVELGLIRSKFVGQTSKNISTAFEKVRELSKKAPVIFLLDEFDSLANTRNSIEMHEEIKNSVNTLIKELDKTNSNSIYIICCTNFERNLDEAVKRRFDLILRFRRPNLEERIKLFSYWLKPFNLPRKDIVDLAKKTKGFTPAEIKRVIKEAILDALTKNEPLSIKHLLENIRNHKPEED